MSERMKCRHGTEIEAHAYQVGGSGAHTVTRTRCDFPDNEPSRFVDAPRWLLRQVSGGCLVSDSDCNGCPAFAGRTRHE